MTKFKQKLEILPIKIIQHSFGDTEYYKAVHVKTLIAQADEEFQELKEQHGNQAESILLMLDEIKSLKSQLQQQALPVVPEYVAGAIEKDKQANISISDVFEATFSYENHHLTEAGLWTKNNPEKYIIARNIGYTVEKPQLFYLKNKLTRQYLYRRDKVSFGEQDYCKDYDDKPLAYCLFTKQEIDSMQTGSYEQIEVAE